MTQTTQTSDRSVTKSVRGMATSDGAGVKLTRVIGTSLLRRLDPFLMLDEFRSDEPQDYLAGFPDHPHRGFETFTPIGERATAPIFIEIVLPAGGEAIVPVPRGHEGFVYPVEGSVAVGDQGNERTLVRGELAVLGEGEHVRLRSVDGAARALVVAGKPLNEPIVQHGPFVMNTAEEIQQDIRDFSSGKF